MFCAKCGGELPDGSKFCSACGANLAELTPETTSEQHKSKTITNEVLTNGSMPEFVKPKKKSGIKKTVVVAAIAAAVVLVVVLGAVGLLLSAGNNNAYAYLSNGKYALITDLDKEQVIEIASSKADTTTAGLLSFSPDGKYLYYYTKYDSDSKTGSLCRAEYGKLKEESSKNDKYIEIIATNVALGFRFLNDGTVTYENSDGTLYYFNGKETTQIAKNVRYYFTDESKRIVYTTGDAAEGYTLYGVELSDIDNKIKLASNVANTQNISDFNNILYTQNEDDGSQTLYVAGFEKEGEKIAESVSNLTQVGGKTYFTAENGVMLSLYDFVEDPHADADTGITEPNRDDFSILEFSYTGMNREYSIDSLSDSEIEELIKSGTLYASTTRVLPTNLLSMQGLIKDYEDKEDNTHIRNARNQMLKFVENFSDDENEDGYIVVTDAVREALQNIANSWANPEERDWLKKYCYVKYQSGTTTDYDAYNAASNKWYEAKNRISMREALKNKENDYAVRTLYCFDKGSLTTIDETVLNARSYTGAIVFNTTDLITETVKLENVSSAYDVRSIFDIDNEAENYIILADGTSCRMSTSAAETFTEAHNNGYATLYFTNKEVYMSESNGALSMAAISGGVVGDFSIVTDDAKVLSIDGATLYYASGSYQNNDVTYCDLYSCTNGTSTRMARDVMLNNINLYSDGVILAYTDYRSNSGFELTMIDTKGEATLIGDNITQYIRVNKSTLLYISDGDLYSYNGKEKKMVRSEVDWLWSQNSMEIDNTFGWYGYGYDYYS